MIKRQWLLIFIYIFLFFFFFFFFYFFFFEINIFIHHANIYTFINTYIYIYKSIVDIKNGAISNINKVEREKIDILYFFTASTGVLIMIFTLSRNQIRAKFNHDNNSIVTDYSSYGKNSYKNNNQFDNFNFSMNNSIHGRDNYVNDNGYTRNINDLSLQNNMRMNGLNKSIRDSQISSFSINNENAAMNSPSMVYFKNILTNKNEKPILHNSGARITDNGMMDNYSHYSTSPSSHNNYMSSPLAYNSYVNDVGDGSSGAGSQYYPSNNKRVSNDNSTIIYYDDDHDHDTDIKHLLKNKK